MNSLVDIISYSRDGFAIVKLQFAWDIDSKYTMLHIREKINKINSQFPEEAKRPFIMDFNPSSMPILELVVSSEKILSEFNNFAKDVIKVKFSQIDGVAGAIVSGLPQDAIQIIIDKDKLANYGIEQNEIEKAIKENLQIRSFSNRVKVAYAVHNLTIKFPIHKVNDILEIPIKNRKNVPIRIKDIAQVEKTSLPFYSHVYDDKLPALYISVFKESGTNSIDASKKSLKLIEQLRKDYPNYNFHIIKNQGSFVDQAINSLKQSIGIGAILAFFVIMLFLKKIRYSLIIATIIPVSLLFTFNALFFHNITFNIMTLGGLALGIGLIVDNGIVVLDSIEKRQKQELSNEKNSDESIYKGVKIVRRAIAGSTFTTIAIFFPIVYIKGYTAVLFKEQALAIIYVLLISLFASLTLVPVLFKILNRDKKERITTENRTILKRILQSIFNLFSYIFSFVNRMFLSFFGIIYNMFDKGYEYVEKKYHHYLEYFLNNKNRLFILISIFFIIVFAGYKFILDKQYWPKVPVENIEISITVPAEYPYKIIKEETKRTIDNLLKIGQVKKVITQNYDPYHMDYSSINSVFLKPGFYTIIFSINLEKAIDSKKIERQEFKDAIVLQYSDIEISYPSPLKKEIGNVENKNLIVNFSGKNEEETIQQAKNLKKYLENFTNAEDIMIDDGGVKRVNFYNFNMDIINNYGLSIYNTASELQTSISGKNIGYWQKHGEKIPIMMFIDSAGIKSETEILQEINDPANIPFRNSQLFESKISNKKLERKRVNNKDVISLSAFVNQRNLKSVADEVNEWINNRNDKSVKVFISGESVRTAESFYDLFLTFLIAVIIVYLILSAQFESLLHPINIMLIVPIGVSGAIFSLILFGLSLNVISIIGIVMLIGIGVNDAIIKLDFMVYLRNENKLTLREVIMTASREKFRPIIMTTLTTIVAMLPMAFGFGGNSEINQPLSISIIGGLTFTTVLTLFVTPVVFEIMEGSARKDAKTQRKRRIEPYKAYKEI